MARTQRNLQKSCPNPTSLNAGQHIQLIYPIFSIGDNAEQHRVFKRTPDCCVAGRVKPLVSKTKTFLDSLRTILLDSFEHGRPNPPTEPSPF